MQAQASSSLLTVSPPDTFSPRPEFVNSNHVSSSFALFAIAGAGLVRLSSFEPDVVSSLRLMFKQRFLLKGTREEHRLGLLEFSLLGKPWVHKHAAESEKLFVEILAVIFQHGYRFLSTIDYGREQDDRVSIAFSKPETLVAEQTGDVRKVCLPFALSFPASTLLRVINPPLSNSPAILQAARQGWPRGVVSEKKTGEQVYEFRLKGYRWFQADTFSSDSLNHIFSLLRTLDRHGFTLLTSININGNHSRVKDMWLFLGPPEEIPFALTGKRSSFDLRRSISPTALKTTSPASLVPESRSSEMLHLKSGSFPGSLPGSSTTLAHGRAASDPSPPVPLRPHTPPNSALLKKAASQKYAGLAPPIQSPLSRSSEEEFPLRRHDLSPIDSEGLSSLGHASVDMTGIGAAGMAGIGSAGQKNFFGTKAAAMAESSPAGCPASSHKEMSYRGGGERVKTGELFYETGLSKTGPVSSDYGATSSSTNSSSSPEPPTGLTPMESADLMDNAHVSGRSDSTPFIMNSTVFRDSAFSSGSNQSMEIPIAWTGPEGKKAKGPPGAYDQFIRISSPETDDGYTGESEGCSERISQSSSFRASAGPRFQGHWQPSPIDERPEDQGGLRLPEDVAPDGPNLQHPERKHVNAERVASPTLPDSPDAARQSEVALYGMVSMQTPNSPSPAAARSSAGAASSAKSDGWVLVNVAEDPNTSSSSLGKAERRKSPPHSSLSPIAKAIAAEDAKSPEPRAALRRFLPNAIKRGSPLPGETESKQKKGRRPSIRERFRKKGD